MGGRAAQGDTYIKRYTFKLGHYLARVGLRGRESPTALRLMISLVYRGILAHTGFT
jgi:hypothetical protein